VDQDTLDFENFCRSAGIGDLATENNTHPNTFAMCGAFRKFFRARLGLYEPAMRRAGNNARIHLDFCANDTLNAFATRCSDKLYLIGINAGALNSLGVVFEQLFAAGSPLTETVRIGPASRSLSKTQIVPTVALLAACEFLFSHELGHIMYGHTDLIHQNGGTELGLFEATSAKSYIDRAALYQSMEVDADLHASTRVIGSLSRMSLCGMDMTHFVTTEEDLFRISIIAVLVMFHLFYGERVGIKDYMYQSHPLPEIRLLKFLMRADQMKGTTEARMEGDGFTAQLLKKVIPSLPDTLRESLFPALRLERRLNMAAEAKRIRENENLCEKRLQTFAMMPVGAAIV